MACPDCFKGALHDYADPVGTEEIIHGIKTYIGGNTASSTPSTTSGEKSTIIFVTDAFGFKLINNKLLVDYYATKTGFRVLMPDIMPGGGVSTSALTLIETVRTAPKWWDIRGHFRRLIALAQMLYLFVPFRFRVARVAPQILAYARQVKASLPAGGKLGVAGFCVGGMFTTKLAMEAAVEGGKEALVDAHYTAHPSGMKAPDEYVEGVRKFKVPFSMAIGDKDMALSKDQVAGIEAKLREEFGGDEDVYFEVEIYEGCGHGFAVRADREKVIENEGATKAADQAVSWFERFLG